MSATTRQRLFTWWFGLGYPLLAVGALIISFWTNLYCGTLTVFVLLIHIFVSFRTTCRRCPFYGTAKCGLPGLVTPWIFAKQPATELSTARIRGHFIFDLGCLFYLTGVFCLQHWLLPLAVVWLVGAWLISFGPKRYHGLLHRLPRPPVPRVTQRTSLPVVAANCLLGQTPRTHS
jgi:hypothetical protein